LRWTALVSCGILGALFGALEFYLYDNGIALDTLLNSIGAGLTITDLMIVTFIFWIIAGLWLAMGSD